MLSFMHRTCMTYVHEILRLNFMHSGSCRIFMLTQYESRFCLASVCEGNLNHVISKNKKQSKQILKEQKFLTKSDQCKGWQKIEKDKKNYLVPF